MLDDEDASLVELAAPATARGPTAGSSRQTSRPLRAAPQAPSRPRPYRASSATVATRPTANDRAVAAGSSPPDADACATAPSGSVLGGRWRGNARGADACGPRSGARRGQLALAWWRPATNVVEDARPLVARAGGRAARVRVVFGVVLFDWRPVVGAAAAKADGRPAAAPLSFELRGALLRRCCAPTRLLRRATLNPPAARSRAWPAARRDGHEPTRLPWRCLGRTTTRSS